jgi:isopenicillin N synthase-like dioxygenase
MACVYHDAPRPPVIDLGLLEDCGQWHSHVAQQLDWACCEFGFFYIVRHGIDSALVDRLLRFSRAFFDQDLPTKLKIHMSRGGRAWRGYFPVGEGSPPVRPI